jgi:hypothetical protein
VDCLGQRETELEEKVMPYRGTYVCTITKALTASRKREKVLLMLRIRQAIGRILPLDYGKHVYEINGVIQVENDEQKKRRLARIRSAR